MSDSCPKGGTCEKTPTKHGYICGKCGKRFGMTDAEGDEKLRKIQGSRPLTSQPTSEPLHTQPPETLEK